MGAAKTRSVNITGHFNMHVDLALAGSLVPPTIITHPQSQTVTTGSDAAFSVAVDDPAPLQYQWRFNGTNISGATASSFTQTNAQPGHAGNYSVLAANFSGAVVSSNALLTVIPQPMLAASPAGDAIQLSWSDVYGDWSLEAAESPQDAEWNNVNAVTTTNGPTISLNLPATNGQTFYRLRKD